MVSHGCSQAYRTTLSVWEMAPPYNVTGTTEIDVQLAAPSKCIVLHASSSMTFESITTHQLQPNPGGSVGYVTGAGLKALVVLASQ